MSNKELKFSIVVDPRTAGEAKRVIRELISDAERLAKTLASVNLGGHGGGLLSGGNVGGTQSQGALIASAAAPKQTGPVSNGNKSMAQSLGDTGRGLRELANVSRDSMRAMSDGVQGSVSKQKMELDNLERTVKKLRMAYQDLSQARARAEPGSYTEQVAHKAWGDAKDNLGEQRRQMGNARWNYDVQDPDRAAELRKIYGDRGSHYNVKDMVKEMREEEAENSGPGFGQRFKGALGRGARWGVVGGAIAGGVLAGAGEMQASPFDYITQQSRQSQALGTLGVSTRQGNLAYGAALMQVFNDPEKRKEFGGLGDQTWSTGITQAGGAVLGGLTKGDPNAVGNALRGVESIPTVEKERLRQYMDEQIKSDPRFFSNLDRFQSEADSRVGVMRRMGYGEGNLSKAVSSSGEDIGTLSGAFEATRGGGRSFAQAALWQAMRAQRGGMDMGAAGSVLVAGSSTGTGTGMLNAITQGNDVVAAEHLGRAIVSAMQSASLGSGGGMGLAGALTANGPMSVYQSQNVGAGLGALGGMTSGGDPLGAGINVLNALKITGKGGDLYKQNSLVELMRPENTGMLMDAMSGEDKHGYLKSMFGEDYAEDARKMFQGALTTNVRARHLDQGMGVKLTPASQRMQDIATKYNGDIRAYMDDRLSKGEKMEDLSRDIGVGLHGVFGEQFSVQGGESAVRTMYGAGNRGYGKGSSNDASAGSAAGTYRHERNKTSEEEFNSFVESNKNMLKTLSGGMKNIADVFDRMKDTDVSANHAAKSLLALADAADILTTKWHGKIPNDSNEQLDALRKSAQQTMEAGGTKGMSKNMAATLWKGYKTTGTASPAALAAFKQYGFMK